MNAATKADPYTNSQLDIEETVDGLCRAVLNRLSRMRASVESMTGVPGYLA